MDSSCLWWRPLEELTGMWGRENSTEHHWHPRLSQLPCIKNFCDGLTLCWKHKPRKTLVFKKITVFRIYREYSNLLFFLPLKFMGALSSFSIPLIIQFRSAETKFSLYSYLIGLQPFYSFSEALCWWIKGDTPAVSSQADHLCCSASLLYMVCLDVCVCSFKMDIQMPIWSVFTALVAKTCRQQTSGAEPEIIIQKKCCTGFV